MDYHDYVIKDGKFIGNFEEMYKNCENPWKQKNILGSYSKLCSVTSLYRIQPKKVLEVGCGLGFFANFLKRMLPGTEIIGMDISQSAVDKARGQFPDMTFFQEEVSNIESVLLSDNGSRGV